MHILEIKAMGRGEREGRKEGGVERGVCVCVCTNTHIYGYVWNLRVRRSQAAASLLNINHLCFSNFANASGPNPVEFFINTIHFL